MAFDVLPTKASRSGTGRRIVYLDQNVLTELAKLRLGRLKEDDRTGALRTLSVALHAAVFERQDARCVESFFHLRESSGLLDGAGDSERSRELFRGIWELLLTHSWGLQFEALHQVAEFQAIVTVAAETGVLEYDRHYLWRGAFSDDPNESNEAVGIDVGGGLVVGGVPWQPQTMESPGWAEKVEPYRQAGHYASFEAALEELRQELRERDVEDNRRRPWVRSWGYHPRPLSAGAVAAFIASPAYGELPVNDVLARVGARVLSDRGRNLKDSDGTDMHIMALALPYCDLVITDGHMASVVTGLHLDRKYGTAVLSAGNDGLREAARWLGPTVSAGAVSEPGSSL